MLISYPVAPVTPVQDNRMESGQHQSTVILVGTPMIEKSAAFCPETVPRVTLTMASSVMVDGTNHSYCCRSPATPEAIKFQLLPLSVEYSSVKGVAFLNASQRIISVVAGTIPSPP